MHEFNAGYGNGYRPERFESQHRPGHWFDRPVVLFDNIIEILCRWPEASHSQFNAGLMAGVVIVDRGGIGAALIEGDLFR